MYFLLSILISGFNMKTLKLLLGCLVIIAGFACREEYEPAIVSSADSNLVVEAVLNAGAGVTSIRLSRTFKLDDTARLRGELNAVVVVEGKDNSTRLLSMTGDGIYTSPDLNLVLNTEYRLKIITANGKEYLSDYILAKKTPRIDSLEFKQEAEGVQVYVNTHDDTNNTRYYRWDFDETWEIWSYYYSSYIYENGTVRNRLPAEDVSTCWKYSNSNTIVLGSSVKLQSDHIFRAPVTFIPNDTKVGTEKLAVRYSILLRQYALDKKGYEFYEMMRKMTEGLGSIFDPQPSEIRGNIHCTTDPSELVIGQVSVVTIEEKRFFIRNEELKQWRLFQDCPTDDIPNQADSIKTAYDGGKSIYSAIYAMGGGIAAYNVSTKPCVECPSRGGFTNRPSYW
jgi:Domain of unknown function (DUF4249)